MKVEKITIEELEDFFSVAKLPAEILLGPGERVIDIPKFLDSHFTVLKNASHPMIYDAFYIRLVKLKNLLDS